jgi:hypothetical protein
MDARTEPIQNAFANPMVVVVVSALSLIVPCQSSNNRSAITTTDA